MYSDVDIFISTWSSCDLDNSNINSDSLNILSPKKYVIEDPIILQATSLVVKRNIEPLRIVNNVLSMFYKIKQCNDLRLNYEKSQNINYDVVVRFRPDIKLLEKFIINAPNTNEITIPRYRDFFGINDQFAYGNSEAMNSYSNLYNNIDTLLENNNKLYLKPELLLSEHLKINNIKINREEIDYRLLRIDGTELNNKSRDEEWNNSLHAVWERF